MFQGISQSGQEGAAGARIQQILDLDSQEKTRGRSITVTVSANTFAALKDA